MPPASPSSPSPEHVRPNGADKAAAVTMRLEPMAVPNEAIARLAYEKFTARGGAHGQHEEDWEEARRELTARQSQR